MASTSDLSTSTMATGLTGPSPVAAISSPSSRTVDIAAIIGGVLGGIIVALVAVVMIVPCARRRQKRLRDPGNGNGPRVLRKAGDSEAYEPMINGSWRNHAWRSEEDQVRSVPAGTMLEPGLIKGLPVWPFETPRRLQPVMEEIVMTDSNTSHHHHHHHHHHNHRHPSASYFPQPMLQTSSVKQNPRSMIPRLPSLDKLWPLTNAFRTSIYSSPSTRTKSSGTSSMISRTSRKHSIGRGRSSGKKKPNADQDALVSPPPSHEVLGGGRASMDREIKHARAASGVKYETAPKHQAYTLKNSANLPVPGPSHHEGSAQLQPSQSRGSEHHTRHHSSDRSGHRHHRRQKSAEPSLSNPYTYDQQYSTRHNRQPSAEQPPIRAQYSNSYSQSHSQSQFLPPTEISASRRSRSEGRRARSSTARAFDHNTYPS